MEIKLSVGRGDDLALRARLMEAQEEVLAMEREHIQTLNELHGFQRERQAAIASPLCRICCGGRVQWI
jgi:hypothetical protein